MSLASNTIAVKGRSTEVLSAGEGEALVFLHGGGIVEGFDCFEPLAERFRFVAPLRPGYGATDPDPALNGRDETVEQIVDTLDALKIERATLIGHSLGGWLASFVAVRIPDRVESLVLAAPWGLDLPDHPGADMSAMAPPEIAATLTNDPSIWEGRFPTGPDPEFEAARGREGQALQLLIPGPDDADLPTVLPRIGAPTLLLWGDDDKVKPVGHATEWEKGIPGASLKVFPGAGHLLFHERPDAVEAIAEFAEASKSAA